MLELPQRLGDTPYTRDLWTILAETKFILSKSALKQQLNEVKSYLLNGLLSYKSPHHTSDVKVTTKLPEKLGAFVITLQKFLGLDIVQAYDILCCYLVNEFRGNIDVFQDIVQCKVKTSLLLVDMWEFYRSERLFLLKCVNLLLCPENLLSKTVLMDFIEDFPASQFLDSLIDQFEGLLEEQMPAASTHGSLMTVEIQNRWFETYLREQIEVLHNLILYIDQYRISFKHLERILKFCYDSKFGQKDDVFVKEDAITAREFMTIIGYLENILLLSCLNLSGRENHFKWMDIINNCQEDVIGNISASSRQSPIVFTWTLLKMLANPDDSAHHYQDKLGLIVSNAGVFEYFEKLLNSSIFMDHTTRLSIIAYTNVFKLLGIVMQSLDKRDLCEVSAFLNLIGPVFRHPLNSDAMWNSEPNSEPCLLLLMLLERFPIEFEPFIKAASALVKHGNNHVKELNMLMTDMHKFAEKWDPALKLRPRHTCQVQSIPSELPPQNRSPVEVSWKSKTFDSSHMVCSSTCDFNVLKAIYCEHQNFAAQFMRGEPIDHKGIETILSSLHFIKLWIGFEGHRVTPEEIKVMKQLFTLMACLKICTWVPTKVLGYCVDILNVLLKPECLRILDSDELRIISNIQTLKIFPFLQTIPRDYSQIGFSEYFSSGLIGELVSLQERKQGSYDLLISYLSFLYKLIKNKAKVENNILEYVNFILPGVVFMVEEVLPHYNHWCFSNERDHDLISLKCVGIFHELSTSKFFIDTPSEDVAMVKSEFLGVSLAEKANVLIKIEGRPSEEDEGESIPEPLLLIQKVIVHNILNMDSGSQLLRIIVAGEQAIQMNMEKRLHWFSKKHTMMVSVIRLAMSVLNQMFVLRRLIQMEGRQSRLDIEILTRPPYVVGSMKVIPTIVSYLNNVYCNELPVMSIALLTSFAEQFPRTLFPSMEMEPSVVRSIFMSKLFSNVETTNLKEAVLILICACCEHQPGMCQALFNIYSENTTKAKIDKKDLPGGCLAFMFDILGDVKQGVREVTDPLYRVVVECIVTIWTGFAADIADYLRQQKDFWSSFCSPLINVPRVYTTSIPQIMSLVSLEVFHYRCNTATGLLDVLQKFYEPKEGTVDQWFELLAGVLSERIQCVKTRKGKRPLEKLSLDLQFLLTMKRFFMITLKYTQFSISPDKMATIAEHLMSAIQYSLSQAGKPGLQMLSEIYLFLSHNQHIPPAEKKEQRLIEYEVMLMRFSSIYTFTVPEERSVFLAVLVNEIGNLADRLKDDPILVNSMLKSIKDILFIELKFLVSYGRVLFETCPNLTQAEVSTSPFNLQTRSTVLAISLFYKLLCISPEAAHRFANSYFAPMMEFFIVVLGEILKQNHNACKVMIRMEVAEQILSILLLFSEYEIIQRNFIDHVETHLFLQLHPPEHLDSVTWLESGWANIYKQTLELLTSFILTYGTSVMPKLVNFIALLKESVISAIIAVKNTLKTDALNISITSLNLVRLMIEHKDRWETLDQSSMEVMCHASISCLSTCIVYLTNPAMLRQWASMDVTPVKKDILLHQKCNQLLKLTYITLAVLQGCTPRLVELMTDRDAATSWSPIVALNFNSPMMAPSTHSLTFGALIALAHMCLRGITKTIRISSSGIMLRSARSGMGLGSSVELVMDKHYTRNVFEMSVEFLTAQALLFLLGDNIADNEKPSFQKTLHTEMTFLWEYVERIYRQKLTADVGDTDEEYLKGKKHLPFSHPTKLKPLDSKKVTVFFRKSSDAKRTLSMDDKSKGENKDHPESGSSSNSALSTPRKNDQKKEEEEDNEKFIIFLAKVFFRLIVTKKYYRSSRTR